MLLSCFLCKTNFAHFPLSPIFYDYRYPSSFLSLACMMIAWAIAIRRGPVAVTAFSIATFGSTTRSAAAAAASRSNNASGRMVPFSASRPSLFGGGRSTCRSMSSITSLRQSATATASSDLEEKLQVTHPAYEVVTKDIVTEYGAYCTLYKHKKSGAQLLSVSNDDDNKVGLSLL